MKLSHSSITMYNECPKKYQFKYIDKIPSKPKHYFAFGQSIHSALEFMYSGDKCPSLDEILKCYGDKWVRVGYKDAAQERKAMRDGENMLVGYHAKHAQDWKKPIFTEMKFDITIDHVRLTGFIDRIDALDDGGLEIIDYKTGKELEPDRQVDDEQLTMYQIAVESLNMGKVTRVSLYHVPSLTSHMADRHGAELVEALMGKIVRTADAIARHEFTETPSEEACSYCDYKALCPAWKE